MSKDQKTKSKKNVENVNNFSNYFNESFETIEMNIKYAREIKFILERVVSHFGNNWPENLYRSGLTAIISWIDTSIDLHYKQIEFSDKTKLK